MANLREGEINAQELQEKLSTGQPPVVVDVREPYEYAQGHIAGCTPMPMGSVPARMHELPKDRDVVVICRSGSRSGVVTQMLRSAGHKAFNLTGGLLGWKGPLER